MKKSVIVAVHPVTKAVITVNTNKPEFGTIRVDQAITTMENGFLNNTKRSAFITGKVADPWDIRDAFLANGLYLKALGAGSGAQNAEFNAAMKYYCGGSCTSYDRFYGTSVVNIANQYDADIKAIGE